MAEYPDQSEYAFEYSKQYQPPKRVESFYALQDEDNSKENKKNSVYFLEKKPSDYAIPMNNMQNSSTIRGNYHYVTAEELVPLPAVPNNKGQLCTRKELLSRVQRLQPGYYQPVISGGQLHFISSGDSDTRTARDVNSGHSLRNAQSPMMKSSKSALTLNTARSNKSLENHPQTARIAGSDVTLNAALLHVKRITPKDIEFLVQIPGFRESLAQFKMEKKAKKAGKLGNKSSGNNRSAQLNARRQKGENFEELSTQEYNERLSLHTAMESPSIVNLHTPQSASERKTGRSHSYSTLEPVDFSEYSNALTALDASDTINTGRANSYTNLSARHQASRNNIATGRSNSFHNLNTAKSDSQLNVTARQPTSLNLNTGRQNSYSNLGGVRPYKFGSQSNLSTGKTNSYSNLSSSTYGNDSNLLTATGRTNSSSNLSTGRNNSYHNLNNTYSNLATGCGINQPNISTGRANSYSNLRTGRQNSQSNLNTAIGSSYSHLATGRQNSKSNLATGRASSYSNIASDNDEDLGIMLLETGRTNSYSNLKTGRSKSTTNVHERDVLTAQLPTSVEEKQLLESLDELNKIASRELRSNVSAISARECGSVTENLQGKNVAEITNTPQNFDPRASQSGAGEPIKFSRSIPEEDIRTAVENKSFC